MPEYTVVELHLPAEDDKNEHEQDGYSDDTTLHMGKSERQLEVDPDDDKNESEPDG